MQCGTFRSLALSLRERWQRKFHSTKSRSYIMKRSLNGGVAWRHLRWVLKRTTLIPSQMSAAMLPTLNSPLLRQNEHLKEHRIWPPRKNIIITTSECITLRRSTSGPHLKTDFYIPHPLLKRVRTDWGSANQGYRWRDGICDYLMNHQD